MATVQSPRAERIRWGLPTIAAVVGLAIGFGSGLLFAPDPDPAQSDEYLALDRRRAGEVSRLQQSIESLHAERETTQRVIADLQEEVSTRPAVTDEATSSDARDQITTSMLRSTMPTMASASDEAFWSLAEGVCSTFAENPAADAGQFVAGLASSGIDLEEASAFVAAAFVLLCPDLYPGGVL